jgi:diguanylate cyclase (GGDEF)-like protein
LDIDHFRHFNEGNGHDAGDRALRAVAHVIRAALYEGAYAARYGGEEFAIVLPGVDALRAQTVASEICGAIAQCAIIAECSADYTHTLTVSSGHATFPIHASAPASLLKAADLALYAAKRAGRNRVTAYTPTLLEGHGRLMPALSTARSRDAGEIQLPSGADIEAVQALITAVDLRDGYTAAHSEGVSRYSVAIAAEMGLPAEHIEALRLGGLVHDVGKIGVPDVILRKPGKLTDEEWVMMRAHTTMGEEILRHVEQLGHLLPLVRWHHERLDGSGYPDQLRGDDIPQLVRILSVADVFEAFTAERPYHPGRPAIEGLQLLQREAAQGKMDPYVVEILERILIGKGLINEGARGEQDLALAA